MIAKYIILKLLFMITENKASSLFGVIILYNKSEILNLQYCLILIHLDLIIRPRLIIDVSMRKILPVFYKVHNAETTQVTFHYKIYVKTYILWKCGNNVYHLNSRTFRIGLMSIQADLPHLETAA